jgi:hypothetical protein
MRHIYLDGMTQQETAARMSCSEPTMSRLHGQVLTWFRTIHAMDLSA